MKNKARIELLQPEIKQLAGELRAEVAFAQAKYQWNAAHARVHFKINVSFY